MKKIRFSTFMAANMLALSLLLVPVTTPIFAQPTAPTPETRQMETRDERGDSGLWGLLGLVGLLGLAGLRRRPEHVRAYTEPGERSRI
jgi:MYXO-CTERM domain-containing protein